MRKLKIALFIFAIFTKIILNHYPSLLKSFCSFSQDLLF